MYTCGSFFKALRSGGKRGEKIMTEEFRHEKLNEASDQVLVEPKPLP